MAAAAAESDTGGEVGGVYQHHAQQTVCASRAKYREGRRPRAVKVYTVNLESRYLLIQGVPALGVMKELVEQFALYGTIEEYNPLDDYPAEEFTEVYLIKFQKIQSARIAKRKLDERSFFGSLLHVCYAPEFETVQETREKLQDRRKYIAKLTSTKDQLRVKKQDSNASFRKIFQPDTSDPHTSEIVTGNWNPSARVHHPSQSFSVSTHSGCVASPSGEYDWSVLEAPQYAEHCAEPSLGLSQKTQMTQHLPQGVHNGPNYCTLQRKLPCVNGLGRFMPRTTQLQERKRRREEDNKFALFGKDTISKEIIIGPRLPEAPKIDMEDDSLNTSANLIRNKLKEVVVPVQTPELSEEKSANSQTQPTVKQRRRI
ncbi:RNA-binding protein 48 isoform X2 [Hemicordylus capensis]|uniref:RNA-binding protein 48 isoform X2 n=1 Tax=Hemicordylus capensis TaxID=884348 RepID=UPI0023030E2F|nr:RNA-binding protein 48 isoform X2 [Hemicordylus capensis]